MLAIHLQDVLEQIENCLSCYEPTTFRNLDNDCLCFMRKGNISILPYPYRDSLFGIPLKYFYEVDVLPDATIKKRGINLKEVHEFTKSLVCESVYDWEYALLCSSSENFKDPESPTWIDDERLNETARCYEWWQKYHEVAHNEGHWLMRRIEDITEIQGIHLHFLKEYIFETLYGINGYMPKRYDEFRYDYSKIYSEQITDEKIDELIDRGLKLKNDLTYYVTKSLPEKNLFSDSIVEDVVKHIIDVFVSYHYYSLGKVLVVNQDTN